ncbi:MAG: SMP-30/Gluconolaconase/LRE protein [uncultured bacterium]|nr:MAG: SMP-30/Gluconolaconase/LRE protein [uncultured bacterium]OGT33549.1 MAG: hypothetical protein A3C44_01515 [Gammaproteobacteria bacterium RIFCSPHIGHO2_02_FULL_39_13]OGT49564.1 MAG: hypothetical protein A3E53_00260 [Gammaproteobacteria bacterium RIFCSPHIGHO2_12_FULL_39_24]
MKYNVNSIYNSSCILGEGPIWHPLENVLYWVDILQCELHRLDLETQQHQLWRMPSEITCIVPNRNGGLLIALRSEIAFFTASIQQSEIIPAVTTLSETEAENTMFNDGHCDRQGRFWIGTKDITEKNPTGKIYRLQNNKLITCADNYIVSNGLISSLDSNYFYIADSPRRIIYRYEFDRDESVIHNQKIFAKIADDAGYPDGMTIDSEGCIWSAHFNGWRITRYCPDGSVDRVITMPTQSPTSCCFGGTDLKTLLITSAKRDVSFSEHQQQPLAGNVFALHCDAPGVPEPLFLEEKM